MKVESNGIMIERLREKDIELVRQWRNADEVRKYMNYREYITPEMQKKWFQTIDNFNNFYFIIHYKGKKVGLGNIKNVDWNERSGEAGIFIVDNKLIGSVLPVVGILSLSSLVFKVFKFNKLYAQIRKDNKRAARFNSIFGYKILPGEEGKISQKHVLTKEDFEKSARKFFYLMKPLGFHAGNLKVILEPVDFETGFAPRMEKLLNESTMLFNVKEENGNIVYEEQ